MSSPRPDSTLATGNPGPDVSFDPAAVGTAAEALARIQYGNRALAQLYTGSWEDFARDLIRSAWLATRETSASDRGAQGIADRILRLHRPRDVDLVPANCALGGCHHDSCPTAAVCGHCAYHAGQSDDQLCVISEAAIWPCATVRAINPAHDAELPDPTPRELGFADRQPTDHGQLVLLLRPQLLEALSEGADLAITAPESNTQSDQPAGAGRRQGVNT